MLSSTTSLIGVSGANLLNLFDLRPGRAIKVALLAGGLLAPSAGGAAAAPLAAAAALLPEDLGERSMLGDGGANALGAMLGAAAATSLPRPARIAALGVIVGLTAASEVVSFSQVIDRTPAMRWADSLGRSAAAAMAPMGCSARYAAPATMSESESCARGRHAASRRDASGSSASSRGSVTGPADPPRVAFVVGLATGGTASHVAALVAGCRDAGLDVSVLGPAPTLALLGQAGPNSAAVETYRVPVTDRLRPGSAAVAVTALRSAFVAWRPDVVHAHGVRAGALAALAARSTGRRNRPALAVTVHNAPPDGRAPRLVYGVLERICARRANLLLCASADLLARMHRLGASEAEQFDVAAEPLKLPSAEEIATARADTGAGDRPVVLTVGRLARQKGLDVLIAAAARWRDRDPQPRTVIAGEGPLAAGLRAQASAVAADVLFLGAAKTCPLCWRSRMSSSCRAGGRRGH